MDVIVEILAGDRAIALPAVYNDTNLEVLVPPPTEVEVHHQLPDTHYKLGGTDPTADPTVLVWYDTLGQ